MAEPEQLNPSFDFGSTEALFAYDMARSLDYSASSERVDKPIPELARDAVRTAIRLKLNNDEDVFFIDEDQAVSGLIAALEQKIVGTA